jgi:hypothetical protein
VRLTDAPAAGAPPASVQEAIQAWERARGEIRAQLEHLEDLMRFTAALDPSALRDDLSARATACRIHQTA